jgi:DNA-binding transcriptional LysR family regulator
VDIALLKTFLEVARKRHFGKAAETLCVTQSAVSARVRLLESTLGVPLFSRKRNDIQLTSDGHRLKRHAEMLVKGWERARRELALADGFSHSLAVGSVADLWPVLVRDWVERVSRERPDLALQVEVLPGDTQVQRLLAGVLDVAFLFEPPQMPDLTIRPVGEVPLVLVSTRPGQSAEEALRDGYVAVDWGTAFALRLAEWFPEAPAPGMRLGLGLLALDVLLRQGGSAYLAEAAVRPALQEGRLHRVAEAPVAERQAYAVYRADADDRAGLRTALEWLRIPA